MDALQAAFLKVNLNLYEKTKKKRFLVAQRYKKKLSKKILSPDTSDYNSHSFYDFTILINNRKKVINYLYQNSIEVKVRHPFLINQQPVFKKLPKKKLPRSEEYVKKILQLPIHENITNKEVDYVCKKLNSFVDK